MQNYTVPASGQVTATLTSDHPAETMEVTGCVFVLP